MFKYNFQPISPIKFIRVLHRINSACVASSSANSDRIVLLEERGCYGMHSKMDGERRRDVVRRRERKRACGRDGWCRRCRRAQSGAAPNGNGSCRDRRVYGVRRCADPEAGKACRQRMRGAADSRTCRGRPQGVYAHSLPLQGQRSSTQA